MAAMRHFEVAEHLLANGYIDDAAYHFGVCGENAVKSGMRDAGLEQYWANCGGGKLKSSPMRGHWGQLNSRLVSAATEISLYASGRRSAPLRAALANCAQIFNGWNIDIRYADPKYVPVSAPTVSRWQSDASAILLDLVVN